MMDFALHYKCQLCFAENEIQMPPFYSIQAAYEKLSTAHFIDRGCNSDAFTLYLKPTPVNSDNTCDCEACFRSVSDENRQISRFRDPNYGYWRV